METALRVWAIRLATLLATCFGVFVLPFLIPTPYVHGISASNLAGFNNQVAVGSAALVGILIFFLALKWPGLLGQTHVSASGSSSDGEPEHLSKSLILAVALIWGIAVLLFGLQIIRMDFRYEYDWGYFVNRMEVYGDFGRHLYSQMEFAYGPLLLQLPLVMRAVLRPLHASTEFAYLLTLVLETTGGLWMTAYVLNQLPMSKQWKAFLFVALSVGMMVGNMAPNYTFARFAPQLVFLVVASKCVRGWVAAVVLLIGQAICLGLSPEIGTAFLLVSMIFAAYRCVQFGPSWALALIAPILSTLIFLKLEGLGYLERVGTSAHGLYSFPVEPIPLVLVFLFALVWLVPICLAQQFRQRKATAPMMAALYLMGLALLPAAFGRADPGHIFWNGTVIFLLSGVAISTKGKRVQIAWGSLLIILFIWMAGINRRENWWKLRPVLRAEAASSLGLLTGRVPLPSQENEESFNPSALQTIVGHEPVATPLEVSKQVEDSLRESGQYTPSFYNFYFNLFDRTAEDRQIKEFNQSKWALIPMGAENVNVIERPEDLGPVVGIDLHYRTSRPLFTIGPRFSDNLAGHWKARGTTGNYTVYEHVQ